MTSDDVIISGVESIVLLGDADVHISRCHGGVSFWLVNKFGDMFELVHGSQNGGFKMLQF